MLERRDLEDHRSCGESKGMCSQCGTEIMEWEEHYDIESILIHEECIYEYLSQFKVYI
jgi:hypothetical protein